MEKKIIDISGTKKIKALLLSSFASKSDDGTLYCLKMYAHHADKYRFKLSANINEVTIYDETGIELLTLDSKRQGCLSLDTNQIVFIVIQVKKEKVKFSLDVYALKHPSYLPYDPIDTLDVKKYQKEIKGKTKENAIFKPSEIKYVKRNDGIYINCNNPEMLDNCDLNKALSRVDISNNQVFFTFEHNTGGIDHDFYLGYQVINNGDTDAYVTVRNFGFQVKGKGVWLGEDEWVEFYNTNFRILNLDKYSEKQMGTFNALYGFANNYMSRDHQPITYRIPPHKYIYVMGGTTKDSYNNTNVYNSSNVINNKSISGCVNGVILFDVLGDNVEGCFYAYDDYKKIGLNNKTHQGYVVTKDGIDKKYGRQYVGYDNCNGVVDNQVIFQFNDKTPEGLLPVTFTNEYDENFSKSEEVIAKPLTKLNPTIHTQIVTNWVTHANANSSHNAVGTDMTLYKTVYAGNEVTFTPNMTDGEGYLTNIGNWMIDYIDAYLFVNYGSKKRHLTITMRNNGTVLYFVRNEKGKVLEDTIQYSVDTNNTQYGDPINDYFVYEFDVEPKSTLKFYVEYNLLANSCGHISHEVKLK